MEVTSLMTLLRRISLQVLSSRLTFNSSTSASQHSCNETLVLDDLKFG